MLSLCLIFIWKQSDDQNLLVKTNLWFEIMFTRISYCLTMLSRNNSANSDASIVFLIIKYLLILIYQSTIIRMKSYIWFSLLNKSRFVMKFMIIDNHDLFNIDRDIRVSYVLCWATFVCWQEWQILQYSFTLFFISD